MPSFKSVLYFLGLLVLLTNETFVKLVTALLTNTHIYLNNLVANRSNIFQAIKGVLPNSADDAVAAVGDYYKQAMVVIRPQMQLLAIKLTELTLWTALRAPGALCKVGSWLVSGTQVVAQWLMGDGDGVDGSQAVLMRKLWDFIQGEVAAQCSNAGA
jgi:hypothetical protein